jgi:CheY-like chemotaxis protein
MAAKRALIVDDSKSARVFLTRMLEKYGILVDTSESAEDAIEYLKSNRPDVIFMDHLMPGMDGFQAVQAIKNNPVTATIPIMMYTSQEGELYVGQARALGAIGVMPKQVAPVDVSKVLYQLKLLPDRRDPRPSVLQPVGAAAEATAGTPADPGAALPAAAALGTSAVAATEARATTSPPPSVRTLTPADVRAIVEPALKDQSTELRRFVLASLESFASRLSTETRDLAQALAQTPEQPPPARRPVGWIVLAAAGCLAAIGTGAFAWQLHDSVRSLEARLGEESRAVAALRAELAAAVSRAEAATAAAQATLATTPAPSTGLPSTPRVFEVPYGEPPLAGARVEALRTLFAQQDLRAFTGTVRITYHVGDFCLTGSAAEGYVPAAPDLAASRCSVIGNPYDDALRPAQRQSVAFANWLAEMRASAGGRYSIVVANAARERPAVPYPDVEDASADVWNAAAHANHRVEVAFVPARSP